MKIKKFKDLIKENSEFEFGEDPVKMIQCMILTGSEVEQLIYKLHPNH